MSDEDILSQDEIDALLDGVDCGDIGEPEEIDDAGSLDGPRKFDFAAQNAIVAGRMPAIDRINEEFARNLRDSIMSMIRRTTEIKVREISLIKFSEYRPSIVQPCCLNLVRIRPLRGTAMFVMNEDLGYSLVEHFYGGVGRAKPGLAERKLAPTELRVLDLLLKLVIRDLETAWRHVLAITIEHIGTETNPQMINIVGQTDIVLLNVFEFDIEGCSGELHFCMPYTMIEPVRQQLDAGGDSAELDEIDEQWSSELKAGMLYCPLEINASMLTFELSLEEVMNLKTGDIIPVEMPETGRLFIESVPSYHVKTGVSGDNFAVQLLDRITY